jgi:starvation-inducible DNA-binding protein
LRSSAKRHWPISGTEAGDIGTADIFTRLVQLHLKRRRFLKEIARKDN